MIDLRIDAQTKLDTTDWAIGKKVLEPFVNVDPRLVPELIYLFAMKTAEFTSIDECEQFWATIGSIRSETSFFEFPVGMEWKRKHVAKYEVLFNHTRKTLRGTQIEGSFSFFSKYHPKVDWRRLALPVFAGMRAHYGVLHCFTEGDRKELKKARGNPAIGAYIGGYTYKGGIPKLSWGTYLAEHFKEEVNAEKIANAGFPIEEVGNGYFIQVTDNIEDLETDFEMFEAKRTQLTSMFRKGLFLLES